MPIQIRDLFDLGFGIRNGKIRIRDKYSGSATLVIQYTYIDRTNFESSDPDLQKLYISSLCILFFLLCCR
jgi:hypothetical protein